MDLQELVNEKYYYFISAEDHNNLEFFRTQRPWARDKSDQELIHQIIKGAANASL